MPSTPSESLDLIGQLAELQARAVFYEDGAGRPMLSVKVLDINVFEIVEDPCESLAHAIGRVKSSLAKGSL